MNARQLLDAVPGLSYRQVDLWTRAGYLQTNRPRPGTGNARQYADTEATIAALMIRLKQAGLTTHAAHAAARQLAAGHHAILAPGIELTMTGPIGLNATTLVLGRA